MSYASAPRAPYRDSAASSRTHLPACLPALNALGHLTLVLGLAIAAGDPAVSRDHVRPAAAAQAEAQRPAALRSLADEASLIQPAAQIGGRIHAVAPAGDIAWLAQGRRVWALDLADPERPRDLGPGLLFEGEVDVLAVDGTLGLAAVGADLWALDLADAQAPKLSGRVTLPRPRGALEELVVERILIYQRAAYVQTERWLDVLDWDLREPLRSITVVDLRRPAAPRLAVATLLSVSDMTFIHGLQRVGRTLAVLVSGPMASLPASDSQHSVRLFDLRQPLAPMAGARIEDPSWNPGQEPVLAVRSDPEAARLVVVSDPLVRDAGGLRRTVLTVTDFDVSTVQAPRNTAKSLVPRGDSCDQSILGAWLGPDNTLFLSCEYRHGSFTRFGEIARARLGAEATLDRVAQSSEPLTSPLASTSRVLVAGTIEGLALLDLADSSDAAFATTFPLITHGGDLAASVLGGASSLFSLNGELISLDARDPLRPLPMASRSFGHAGRLDLSDGLATIASLGGGDQIRPVIFVEDLRDPRQPRDLGQIDATRAIGQDGSIVLAQSQHILALRSADDRADLYRLAFDAPPAIFGSVTTPGGRLIGLAMSGDLLATLSLERPSLDAGALSPVTVALFHIADQGDSVQATLLGQRVLATDAQAAPEAFSLLMTPDWLVVSLGLGCGGRKEQGVMLLRLGPAPDEGSLYRQVWMRYTGKALLLHDGYLFVQAWREISALDIRQLAEKPWAWREAARLAMTDPYAMAAIDGTLYASSEAGVSIFQPGLPWASDPGAPTPTEPPTPPPFTPTATASATATPSRTPSATRTARMSATPTRAPGRRLWLPLVGN